MKKMLMVLLLSVLFVLPASADGNVIYDGTGFVLEPGSNESVTDLFTEFKDVMPGDVLTQKVTVRNVNTDVKVKIYLRSLGAHDDSVDFLSQLHLSVALSEDNTMGYMFDASADETAGLTDWVLLGTLYAGGEVNLDVKLSVPVTLSNEYMNEIGYLDWEFMVEEFPVEESDPLPPLTGDETNAMSYAFLAAGALVLMGVLFVLKRKKEEQEGNHSEKE